MLLLFLFSFFLFPSSHCSVFYPSFSILNVLINSSSIFEVSSSFLPTRRSVHWNIGASLDSDFGSSQFFLWLCMRCINLCVGWKESVKNEWKLKKNARTTVCCDDCFQSPRWIHMNGKNEKNERTKKKKWAYGEKWLTKRNYFGKMSYHGCWSVRHA